MNSKSIAIATLGFIIIGSLATLMLRPTQPTSVVEIKQNNTLLHTITLSEVTSPYTLTLETGDTGYNLVQVTRDTVTISEANCPDQLCVHQGELISGAPIVCLPHRISISFLSEGGYDVIAN